jgi:hypothetical protein
MKVTLALVCDYANVTIENKLNILGIFQEMNPPAVPFVMPQMFLVMSFRASAAEVPATRKITVSLLNDDEDEIFRAEQTVEIAKPIRPGAVAVFNTVLGLQGLAFAKAGDHAFHILIDGDEKEQVELRVNEPQVQELAQ